MSHGKIAVGVTKDIKGGPMYPHVQCAPLSPTPKNVMFGATYVIMYLTTIVELARCL